MGDHSNSGRQSTTGSEEEESDEDSSSSSSNYMSSELDQFRQEWFNELREQTSEPITEEELLDKESEARRLFCKGIDAEREGRSGEAVYWYRRATHLCPDVESTITIQRRPPRRRVKSRSSVGESTVESTSTDISSVVNIGDSTAYDLEGSDLETNEDDVSNLLDKFKRLNVTNPRVCVRKWPQSSVHISELPTEILIRIICCVVGQHLDVRSLDTLALVCRGFYVLARDDQIWAKVCRKIWRNAVDRPGKFGLWREMYLNRPRVHFNGCYISKMSYMRQGEQSMDGFYQVVNIVEYYRYIRFFTDGRVQMVTSPESPMTMVYKMASSSKVHGMLEGSYRLVDEKVSIMLQRTPINYCKRVHMRHKPRPRPMDTREDRFHVEFSIKNCGKRHHYALVWNYYSLHTKFGDGSSSETSFDLTYQKYPPLYFSPVKSYSLVSDGHL